MNSTPEFVVSIIKYYWSPGQKILDIGCGPAFLRKYFESDYMGLDITNEPYRPDLPRDVDLVSPADHIELESEYVDLAVIQSAFFLFENPRGCLKEVDRVLKMGGHLLVFDYNRRTQKMLCRKEGHNRYPRWTQWGLKRLVVRNGFMDATLLLPANRQPRGLWRILKLLREETSGQWAIVHATKKRA